MFYIILNIILIPDTVHLILLYTNSRAHLAAVYFKLETVTADSVIQVVPHGYMVRLFFAFAAKKKNKHTLLLNPPKKIQTCSYF